jgi:hypothetical protein
MKRKLFVVAAITAALFASVASAGQEAFFTVTGKISQGNGSDGKKTYVFDRAAFDKLPQTTVRTSTSWTDGVHAFKGPLLRDVLKLVGAQGNDLEAFAIDDYMSRLPVSDATKYNVIIAESMDDKPLPMDKFGPLWIVYPRDQFPSELKNPITDGKFAWQLYRLSVK